MSTTDSRLKTGILTLDALAFAGQSTSVTLTPPKAKASGSDEVLDGTVLGDDTSADPWVLAIEAIQDFTNAAGLQKFLFDNEGDTVPYSWKPNATGPTFSGSVIVVAPEIGGAVGPRIKTKIEMNCTAKPVWTVAV